MLVAGELILAATTPRVDYIRPNSGSVAGGQLVSIHGVHLQLESSDPLVPATTVTIGGVACDVQRVLSTAKRVVCRTRPYASHPAMHAGRKRTLAH